jgi:small subunit ribosomal protein S16
MLAIRMQRTGRKGHAMFRVIVQDSRRTPTSGRIVAHIGSYDPHSKSVILQKDKASFYLEHGAQPSGRVVKLLAGEGVKLPKWVAQAADDKQRTTRHADKLRKNRPPEAKAAAAPAAEEPAEAANDQPVEQAEAAAEAQQSDAAPADQPAAGSEPEDTAASAKAADDTPDTESDDETPDTEEK